MSAPSNLAKAREQVFLVPLRQNRPFGLFSIAEEQDYWRARGLTLQQRDAAIDASVARGWARLRIGEEGVWVELAESAQ